MSKDSSMIYAMMRKINEPEGFNAEKAAIQITSAYHGEETIMSLPADVRKAWFRLKYPQGHCEDEPFGICNENVANVKVTVYATGDRTQELAHAYASRTVIPETVDSRIPKDSLPLHLYKAAVGMAKATALMEAGIGMGYYQSIDDFNSECNESLNPILEQRLRGEMPLRTDYEYPASVPSKEVAPVIPKSLDTPEDNKAEVVKTRRNAAAVAEGILHKIEDSVARLCELDAGMKQDGLTPALVKSMKEAAAKETKNLSELSSNLTERIKKAVKTGNDDVLKVVSFDALNAVLQKLPDEYADETAPESEAVTETTEDQEEKPVETVTLVIPEPVPAETPAATAEAADYTGYVPTSDVISKSNIGGKAISDYSDTEIKFILGKANKGLLNETDTAMAIVALKAMYPTQVELCRSRFPEIGI